MNLLADESVSRVLIERLRADGHTVLAVGEASPGVADTQVLEEAVRTRFVLLTEVKDFGELVNRRGASHHGIVLIRLAGLSRMVRAALVSEAFKAHGAEFVAAFTVITSNGIRIRPPASSADKTGSPPN
jgi:predicted nuclease of predicted toxin-antitoxin system